MTLPTGKIAEEQLRKLSARATKYIAVHRGEQLGMTLGCGFPKSGTVWLCQMLGAYLGVPYPRNYQAPIAMESVVHTHWDYDPKFPRTAYIVRDGRDVLVSMYFYYVRAMNLERIPLRARELRREFAHLYGPNFDPNDVHSNLPAFIENFWLAPRATRGLSWQSHVTNWVGKPNVATTTYEELRQNPYGAFGQLVKDLTGEPIDDVKLHAAISRYSFEISSGRTAGTEDRKSFLRKGLTGDWVNHFTQESGELFEEVSGEGLRAAGYENDATWVSKLPTF